MNLINKLKSAITDLHDIARSHTHNNIWNHIFQIPGKKYQKQHCSTENKNLQTINNLLFAAVSTVKNKGGIYGSAKSP